MKTISIFALLSLSLVPSIRLAANSPENQAAHHAESPDAGFKQGLISNLELTAKDANLSDSERGVALVKVVQSALAQAAADAKDSSLLLARAAEVAAIASEFMPDQADLFIDAVLAFPGVSELKNAESFVDAAVAKVLGEQDGEVETAQADRRGHHRRHEFHGNRRDCVISKSTVRDSK